MSKQKKWMKLDNAAKIYPAARSGRWMSMFRLSATLCEPIEPEVLIQAQERTLKRFPSIALRLRHGFFWYYLEQIEEPAEVVADVRNPCVNMNFKKNGGYMFRIRYYESRIAVEFFHVLTDGTGGMCFLKTLIAEYLTIKYGIKIPRSDTILDCDEKPKKTELEDSYIKYARHATMTRREAASFHLEGTPEEKDFVTVTTAIFSATQVLTRARELKVTVTEYILAHLIMAFSDIQKRELGKKPVKICVPVNLRKFYPTNTMRNFAAYVNIGISPIFGSYTFEEVLKIVKHQMGLETSEKLMNARMSTNVNSEKNKFLRIVPLFLKKPTLRVAFKLIGDRTSSTTFSNLGNIALPDEMTKYVKRFDFMLGALNRNRVVLGCLSYNDTMCINIIRSIKEPIFEKEFITRFVKDGIHVKVESNVAL